MDRALGFCVYFGVSAVVFWVASEFYEEARELKFLTERLLKNSKEWEEPKSREVTLAL
jgi:hypothetical protein